MIPKWLRCLFCLMAMALVVQSTPAPAAAPLDASAISQVNAGTVGVFDNYLLSEFTHSDYPNLFPCGQTVDTTAVGSVMAVYAWQPGTEQYTKVARFVNAFFKEVRSSGGHSVSEMAGSQSGGAGARLGTFDLPRGIAALG